MVNLVLLFIFALSLLYVLEPLFRKHSESDQVSLFVHKNLEIRKRLVLEGLKDLDLDHQSAKMDETDYQSLKADLMAEGTSVLKEIEVANNESK